MRRSSSPATRLSTLCTRFSPPHGYTGQVDEMSWKRPEIRRRIVLTTHRRESLGETMRRQSRVVRRFVEAHDDVALIFPVHPNPVGRRGGARRELAQPPRIHLIDPLGLPGLHPPPVEGVADRVRLRRRPGRGPDPRQTGVDPARKHRASRGSGPAASHNSSAAGQKPWHESSTRSTATHRGSRRLRRPRTLSAGDSGPRIAAIVAQTSWRTGRRNLCRPNEKPRDRNRSRAFQPEEKPQ